MTDYTNSRTGHPGWPKLILFSLTPLVLLLLCAELLLRVISFQLYSEHLFALEGAFERIQSYVIQEKTDQNIRKVRSYLPVYQAASEALYQEEGEALRRELEAEYTRHFQAFVDLVDQSRSKLVVLSYSSAETPFGQFITALTNQHSVDHINIADRLAAYPEERIRLLPHDLHLSRFGNFIVADALADYLGPYRRYRNSGTYEGAPELLGDLPPNISQIYSRDGSLPFHVQSNTQGLRMTQDVEIPKKRQRILCIGDSNTFGHRVHTQDTYPALLARQSAQWEVLNAGITGYTISDELALFREQARHAAPDITVLQVTHNDIIELTAYRKNLTGRAKEQKQHLPSAAERMLFELMERRSRENRDSAQLEPEVNG